MGTLVKQLVKKTNKAITSDKPPTKIDVDLRKQHTDDSVDYNLHHIKDHGENMIVNLGKLAKVDRAKAKRNVKQIKKVLDDLWTAVQKVS